MTACSPTCPSCSSDKFNIRHMTVQLERDNRRQREPEHF